MKENVYTIPINEAFHEKSGCPMCRLYRLSCEKALDYITGAAMMEPDVREESNKFGFCAPHLNTMLSYKKRLPVALMLESHMDQVAKAVYRSAKGLMSSDFDPEKLAEKAEKQAASCFVCIRAQREAVHYVENAVHMWQVDTDFRNLFSEQEYFCLSHMASLLREAKKTLGKRDLGEFTRDISRINTAYHDRVREDLAKFTRSFDYRFAEDAKDPAVKSSCDRTAGYLEGDSAKLPT